MSTKTMHLPPRRNKRKEREDFDALKQPNRPQAKYAKPTDKAEPGKPNLLLAGYMAHEFLTEGTLFGKPWDSARAELRTVNSKTLPKQPSRAIASAAEPERRYFELASLLSSGGAQLPGVVNPTQLARLLHE